MATPTNNTDDGNPVTEVNGPPRASAVTHRTRGNTSGYVLRNPNPRGNIIATKLDKKETAQMLDDLRDYVTKFNMNPAGLPPIKVTTTLHGDKRGDREKELETVRVEYRPKWEEFSRFAWRMGDFRSACICCDAVRPAKALPASPETLSLFMQYKVNEANEPVLKSNGQHATYKKGKDAGKTVKGVAKWSHPIGLLKFRVAIRMVHRLFGNCRNDYRDACEDCIAASEQNPDGSTTKINFASPEMSRQYRACIRCGVPHILPKGDPSMSSVFESTFNSRYTHCENEHVVKGCLALSVKQTRTIRSYFLSDSINKLRNLQMWTIMLLAIRCFLRADEVASIDISDFAIRAIALDKNRKRVEHMALWVRGKADKDYVLLSLWRDDENPEFCPIRAVLIYLAAANLSGGCLFPVYKDLEKHHVDNTQAKSFKEHVSYNYIRIEMKKAIDSCFGGDKHAFAAHECKVGTHTMRKTAYLFAVFSVLSKYDLQGRSVIRDGAYRIQPLEMDDIEKAARHGNHQSSSIYFAANSNKYERFGPSNDAQWPHHRVSPWKSVFYCSSKSKESYEANEDLTTRTDWPIIKIAHWFVREELEITTSGWDPIRAIELSCRYRGDRSTTAIEEFKALLMSHLPTALYNQAKDLFQQCCKEVEKQHDEERQKRNRDSAPSDDNSNKKKKSESTPCPPKKDYEEEMKALQIFKRENKGEKKLVFEKILQFSLLPRDNTTKKARTWLTKLAQTARCVQFCVANCHKGEWQSWEASMKGEVPIGGYQKWKCVGCNAKMDEIKNE